VIRPGEIVSEHASRHFKVYPREARRLKDVVVARRRSQPTEVRALSDVSFHVDPGSAIGLVGRNGSGKTTLLRLVSGIIKPTSGRVDVGGRVGSLLELGAGFHPDMTGRENVFLNGSIHGLKRAYVREQLDEIVAFAGLEQFIDLPVRTYSSGMYMRLGFSVAMHIQPDILLLDEVLAVGDEAFQQKCFERLTDFKRAGGTIVFVSHDPIAVERLCDRALMLEGGHVLEEGLASEIVSAYHRRVVSGPAEEADRHDGAVATRCRVHEVRAVAGDGTARDRFVEGEPMALEASLYAEQEIEDASVTVGIRDADGRPVGSQTLDGVRLPAGRLERLRLNFPGLPMREGRFFVDVGVTTADRDAELALAERALELSVFGSDAAGSGPIRLGGTWELPAVDGTGDG
jgi:ABC-type polysaccharide/polyol phosphate transport system ATPase subunit